MATSSIVFIFLVAFAVVMSVAVFAWMAGNKHNKYHPTAGGKTRTTAKEEPPQFWQREAWADETAARDALPRQGPTSMRTQPAVCDNRPPSTATRRRPTLNSSTTQWDRADTWNPVSQNAPNAQNR